MSAKKKSSPPKPAQHRAKRSEKQRKEPREKVPATAIWTREAILSLSEEDFSRNILVPLFREMGYQEVRYSHGGSLEQGKDLVMWRANEFGVRRNYAVVVKAEPIGGSATALAKTVLVQVQQAIGSRYLDEVTREEHRIHEVILANSQEVSKEADTSIHHALEGIGKDHLLSVVAGEKLWDEISKHLPDILLFNSLAEAQRALSSIDDPDWHVTVQLAAGGTHFSILPRKPDAPPITVSFEAHFPDSAEGRAQHDAFDKFLATEVKGRFSFNFDGAAENAYWAWQAAQARLELSKGGMLVYQDCDTGFRFRMFELAPGEVPSIDEGAVDLWRKVALIQRRSRTIIPEPDRLFFSPSDIYQILTVERIMAEGTGDVHQLLGVRLEARTPSRISAGIGPA